MTPALAVQDHPVRTSVRFPIRLALLIRSEGRAYRAETIDISANGLLFTGRELPGLNASIEFTIEMPAEVMGAQEDVRIRCLGRVVRVQQRDGQPQAAAIIDEYFLRV